MHRAVFAAVIIAAAIPAHAFAQQATPTPCVYPYLFCHHAYLPAAHRPPSPTPRPTATPTPRPPTPTPPPPTPMPPVMILPSDSTIITDQGELWVMGEVQNNKPGPVSWVKVTANLFDGAGNLLDTGSDLVDPLELPSGQRTCFHVTFPSNPAGRSYHRYEIEYDDTYTPRRVVLDTINVSGRTVRRYDDKYDYEIIGQERNGNAFAVEFAQVAGTVFSPAGKVIGCETAYASVSDLAPGQQSAFKLTYWGYERDYSSVSSFRLLPTGSRK